MLQYVFIFDSVDLWEGYFFTSILYAPSSSVGLLIGMGLYSVWKFDSSLGCFRECFNLCLVSVATNAKIVKMIFNWWNIKTTKRYT
jgi:hypothetical protein